ncbi:MAG TPA: protein kinase [Polyangiaceae bacterium]|nr:protein kinase [Polyangiaceae bacterium]
MRGSSEGPENVREGDILAGKYRVERVLGAGGMGVVVAARHLRLDERVAIKLLAAEVFSDPDALVRFDREARASAKIKSDHVARVTDVGALENGTPYMVMEYLEGEDMAACIRRRGPLSVERAIEVVMQACDAIGEAHRLGIVHRDLKPANLFCARRSDDRWTIKVLDFGISKLTSLALTTRGMETTKAGVMMGSPLYMSPEQMQSSRSVDARTDIWGIGILLYELLTGDVPFKGESIPEVCLNVANQPTPSIRRLRPDAPAGLETVIVKCLQKNRDKRFSNVGELALALAQFGPEGARASAARIARNASSAAPSGSALRLPPTFETPGGSASRSVTDSSWGHTRQRSTAKRRLASLLTLAGVLTLAATAGVAVWIRRGPQQNPVPPSTTEGVARLDLAPTAYLPQVRPSPPVESPSATTSITSSAVPPTEDARDRKPLLARPAKPTAERAPKPPVQAPSVTADTPGPSAVAAPSVPQMEAPAGADTANNCIINFASIPAANVVLDGVRLGLTPLLGVATSSGTPHKVVFIDADQIEKVTTVTCKPGEVKRIAVRLNATPVLDGPAAHPYK